MSNYSTWRTLYSISRNDPKVKNQRLKAGTSRRILGYARPFKYQIAFFLLLVVIDSLLLLASPLILKELIDKGNYYEFKDYEPIIERDENGNVISIINCPYIPKFLVDGGALGFDRVTSTEVDNLSEKT